MNNPLVTIVVVFRERFSYTGKLLKSIYQNIEFPFKLVYVDGNSAQPIKKFLEARARQKDFELIRTDYYLYPNQEI